MNRSRLQEAGMKLAILSMVLLAAARISGRVWLAIGSAVAGALSIICSVVSWITGM